MHPLDEPTQQLALSALPLPVYIIDAEGLVEFWNEAAAKTFGFSAEAVLGKLLPIVPTEHRVEFAALRARVLTGETLSNVQVVRRRHDGAWIKLRAHAVPLRDDLGHCTRVLVLAEDVSGPSPIEIALRQSEERFQKAFEACPDVMLLTRKGDGCILAFNESAEKFFGIHGKEILGSTTLQANVWVNPAERARFISLVEEKGRARDLEYFFYGARREKRLCRISAETVLIDDEECIISVARDITAQRQAEHARRESDSRYQTILDNTPSVVFLKDLDGKYLTINRTFARELGLAASEVVGKTDFDLFPLEIAEAYLRDDQRMLDSGAATQCDDTVVTPSGVRYFFTVKFPLKNPAGKVYALCGIATEVSERRKAEAALSESNAMLGVISRAQAQFIAETDLAGTFRTLLSDLLVLTHSECGFVGECLPVNGKGRRLHQLAIHDLEWSDDRQQFDPAGPNAREATELSAAVLRALQKSDHSAGRGLSVDRLVLPFFLRNEMLGLVVLAGRPGGYTVDDRRFLETVLNTCASLVEAQHANDRRRLAEENQRRYELQLRQASKMEAIGTLAGGVAHDFNNILTGIFNAIELARFELPAGHGARPLLNDAMQAGQRAKSLVNQILTFSRQHEQQRVPLRLGCVVQEAMAFLRATMPASIRLGCVLHDSAATIMADPTQVHQIVMNLGTNAAHAMRLHGGTMECRTEIVELAATNDGPLAGLRPGRFVQLTITDTGVGMDATTLERIFEPFYTTKPAGEGTGLGLSVVHGIMQGHDGAITVESRPGEGTAFRLLFPVIEGAPDAGEAAPCAMPRGRGERIIWVDDEEMVTITGRLMLVHLGYQVTVFNDSTAALAAITAQPDCFDLAVLDLNMPRLTGDKLAAEIRQLRPDARLLLMTGYIGNLGSAQVQQLGFFAQVAKPFTYEDLAQVVRAALDETRLVW